MDKAQRVASHSPGRALLPRELKLNWEAILYHGSLP